MFGVKDHWAKEAAEIGKQFGDSKVTLFKFPMKSECGEKIIYAILAFDKRNQNYEDIFKVDNYHVLISYHVNDKREKRSAEEKVRVIKSILPYELLESSLDIDFDRWEKRVMAHPCKRTYSYY